MNSSPIPASLSVAAAAAVAAMPSSVAQMSPLC